MINQKWIPAETPPEKDGTYLVAVLNGSMVRALHYNGSRWLSETGLNPGVTHWMHFPVAPSKLKGS